MCGIAGVFGVDGASPILLDMLFALQHRGQESVGLATRDDSGNIRVHKAMGLVKQVFTDDVVARFPGGTAIGHVRYPTAGKSDVANAQPHALGLAQGSQFAVSSNGDIINYAELRRWLETEHGFTFLSDNDGELIGRLIAFHAFVQKKPIEEAILAATEQLKGAFSTVVLYRDQMFVFRDPHGFRPLVMGHIGGRDAGAVRSEGTVFASESCSFGIVGAELVREIEPGELVRLSPGQPVTTVARRPKQKRHCVFELIYFSRPDSQAFGERVYDIRLKIGAALARGDDAIVPGDDLGVMPVPDSSNFVALGYARAKNAAFDMGLLRNHYVGRTFIKPSQKSRDEGVRQKFHPLPGHFPGKRIVLVDDSIVRGTTLRKIVRMVRDAGAKEIHVRIGSPKVIGACYYGIDTPKNDELIANRMSEVEIADYLGADTLRYVTVPDFRTILGSFDDFCFACFNRDYMYPPEDYVQKTNAPNR